MADVRQKVNQCTDDLVTALSNLQSVSWVEHDECTPTCWPLFILLTYKMRQWCVGDFV